MTAKMIFSRRFDAEEDLARDHERPQIETALAARDPGAVDPHQLVDRFDEHGFGDRRHRHAIGRIVEAPRIGVGTEQVHAAVVALVGLEAFENFLGVVQHGRGRIEREIGAGFDPRVVPALGLVVADDRHVIGEDAAEAGVRQLGRAILLGRRVRRRLNVEFHGLVSCCRWRRPLLKGPLGRITVRHGLSPGLARICAPGV